MDRGWTGIVKFATAAPVARYVAKSLMAGAEKLMIIATPGEALHVLCALQESIKTNSPLI